MGCEELSTVTDRPDANADVTVIDPNTPSEPIDIRDFSNRLYIYDQNGAQIFSLRKILYDNFVGHGYLLTDDIGNKSLLLQGTGYVHGNDLTIFVGTDGCIFINVAAENSVGYVVKKDDRFNNDVSEVEEDAGFQQVPCDQDLGFKGKLRCGADVALVTQGTIGRGRYSNNQESGGFNEATDTVVLADGIGGKIAGEWAAHIGTRAALNHAGELSAGVQAAHNAVKNFSNCVHDMSKKPDAVLAAIQIDGKTLNTALIGDAKIYVIRDRKIVFRTEDQSVIFQNLKLRNSTMSIEEIDLMVRSISLDEQYVGFTGALTQPLLGKADGEFNPDCQSFPLESGDRVVLITDGAFLPDQVFLEAVCNNSVEEAVNNVLTQIGRINNDGQFAVTLSNGTKYVIRAARDNGTVAVVNVP